MAKYRKKPVVIDAIQVPLTLATDTHNEFFEAIRALGANRQKGSAVLIHPDHLKIITLEGTMRADPGDWIIRGVKGELYPVKPDIFESLHELDSIAPAAGGEPDLRAMQRINEARYERWMAGTPGWTMLESAAELAGEVGELANYVKKLRRSELGVPGNKEADNVLRVKATGEVGDVLITLMMVASKVRIDVHDAVVWAFNRKSAEMGFPERFASPPFEAASE